VQLNCVPLQFTGTWYWLYHLPHKYDDNMDCPVTVFEAKPNNIGVVRAYMFLKRWAQSTSPIYAWVYGSFNRIGIHGFGCTSNTKAWVITARKNSQPSSSLWQDAKSCSWTLPLGWQRLKIKVSHHGSRDIFATLLLLCFELFTAVTKNNTVYWDIETQFVPHRRHITSPLQNPAS
jgi:hypothetical protein